MDKDQLIRLYYNEVIHSHNKSLSTKNVVNKIINLDYSNEEKIIIVDKLYNYLFAYEYYYKENLNDSPRMMSYINNSNYLSLLSALKKELNDESVSRLKSNVNTK